MARTHVGSTSFWQKRAALPSVCLAVLLLSPPSTSFALAPCHQQGATEPCSVHGQPGERECDGSVWSACYPVAPTPAPPVIGTVRPKYYVVTVIYAPPGTNGGRSSSSVAYANGSTEGSTVSSSSSFRDSSSLTISTSGSLDLIGQASASLTLDSSHNQSDSRSLDIRMSSSSEINDPGPASDGVDHNHDLIYLWLNPLLQVKLFSGANGRVTSVNWGLLPNGPTILTYVYVGWLKNPSQMPPGEAQLLQSHGITTADYAQILKVDPYASSQPVFSSGRNPAPDPHRYQSLDTTFSYEPP